MPLPGVPQTSTRCPLPSCRLCQQSERVTLITLHHLSPGIEYWRCDICGFLWATRDGEELSAASA
jgi:hypothetical protein